MNVLSIPIKYKYMLHISLPVFMESCPWTTFVLCKYDLLFFFFAILWSLGLSNNSQNINKIVCVSLFPGSYVWTSAWDIFSLLGKCLKCSVTHFRVIKDG